mgnify:CR=1 FL=1
MFRIQDVGGVWLAALVAAAVVVVLLVSGVVYIPNDRVGIVEKRFSLSGSLKSGLIALGGEAGFLQAIAGEGGTARSPCKATRPRGDTFARMSTNPAAAGPKHELPERLGQFVQHAAAQTDRARQVDRGHDQPSRCSMP